MFGLAKLYENRLNANMKRHLDAKIAPSRPKPSCRPIFYDHLVESEVEPKLAVAEHFNKTTVEATTPTLFVATTKEEKMEESPLAGGPAELAIVGFKPLERTRSAESGFFTGHDSDAASNVSFQA